MVILQFLREWKRMCSWYKGCCGCPLDPTKCNISDIKSDEDRKKIIATVERWSKEHPGKTRQSKFLNRYPNVVLDGNGIINISPCKVDPKQYSFNSNNCRKFRSCGECRREFWGQEVE